MKTFNEYRSVPEVKMDIPLLIRVLEYIREDTKNDIDLHKVVENLISLGNRTLSMSDYDKIVKIK
jgi:hypothetical protein